MLYRRLHIGSSCFLIVLLWQNEIVRAADDVVAHPHVDDDVDRLPPAATARLGTSRWRKLGAIGTICFTPRGDRFADMAAAGRFCMDIDRRPPGGYRHAAPD